MAGKLQEVEEIAAVNERHAAHFRQAAAADKDVARFAAQARTSAFGTGLGIQVFGQLLTHHDRVCLPVAPFEIGHNALEAVVAVEAGTLLVEVAELDLFPAGPIEHDVLDVLRHLLERQRRVEAIVGGQRVQHLEVELVALVPALDGAGGKGEMGKGDHARRIEELDAA